MINTNLKKILILSLLSSITVNSHCGSFLKRIFGNLIVNSKNDVDIPFTNSNVFITADIITSALTINNKLHPMYLKLNDDSDISTDTLKGKVCIFIFSASYCSHCVELINKFETMIKEDDKILGKYLKYIHVGVLSLSNDIIEYGQNIYSYRLQNKAINRSIYNSISGVPVVWIFDKEGKPVCGYLGSGIEYDSDKFKNFILNLVNKETSIKKTVRK